MNRKSFLKTTAIAAGTGSVVSAIAKASPKNSVQKQHQEFYELRVYELKNQDQQNLVENYWQNAAIPAYNKLGSKNLGVFTEMKPAAAQTQIFVLIPHNSVDTYLKAEENLLKDAFYQKAGAPYLQAPAIAPAYERIKSSLLQAFTSTPKLLAPERKERFFELRRYESASELTGKKKIEMFNQGGEAAIFKRLNFRPVFFAETLIGEMRPNLTYMITFDNMEEHDARWKSFGNDPEWKRISSMPEYSDKKNVSRITSTYIVPTAYSQI